VEANEIGPLLPPQLAAAAQISEIPNAPVALRAQRVQLQRRPPEPAALAQRGRLVAAPGGNDEGGGAARPSVDQQPQPVVAGRRQRRQRPVQLVVQCAVETPLPAPPAAGKLDRASLPAAVLPHHLPVQTLLQPVLWQHQSQDRKSTRLNSSHVKISY